MNNKEVYQIWAPFGKKWIDWVRPVPFIGINNHIKVYQPTIFKLNLMLPSLKDLDKNDKSMAIIIDLPGCQSVEMGLLLAKNYGFRPIPIYNGVLEQENSRATTNNYSITSALVWGASILSSKDIDGLDFTYTKSHTFKSFNRYDFLSFIIYFLLFKNFLIA